MSETPTAPVPLSEIMAAAALFEASGRRVQAVSLADHILAHFPQHARALHLKGICLAAGNRHEEAAALIGSAIAQGLEDPQHYRNYCAILERLGRLDEAVAAGRRAVALDPTDAESYHNLTIALAHRLDLQEAIEAARAALTLDPQRAGAHMALAEALLLAGEFEPGWVEYEWRFRLPQAPPPVPRPLAPQWDGTTLPVGKRLLLVADQGFGDVIQFARYIPWVRARCANVALACSAELRPALSRMIDGLDIVVKWESCPPYDAYIPLSGLPRLHGTNLHNIPVSIPYAGADPASVAAWRKRLDGLAAPGHLRVGLVWAGRPEHPNDRNRSMPLTHMAALFALPGVSYVLLQKGPRMADAARVHSHAPIINLGASINNFGDTAAILMGLDLLISVDTSAGHLAGALGRPVWILLPHAPDWRWLLHRADTPWYPTARLFRQQSAGNWPDVVKKVCDALATLRQETRLGNRVDVEP